MHVHRYNGDLEWRNSVWPDNAVLIVVLFDCRGDHTGTANTVTAHFHHGLLAVGIQYSGTHRCRVAGSQLENMTHFDTALEQYRAFAAWARVAFHHVTQIFDTTQFDVTSPVDAKVVFAVNVGTSTKVAHHGNAAVNDELNRQTDRTQRARACI